MTGNYRGCTRGTLSRDSPCADDKDPERHFPGSPDSTQICKTLGQEGAGRFFCVTGTRDKSGPGECQGHPM